MPKQLSSCHGNQRLKQRRGRGSGFLPFKRSCRSLVTRRSARRCTYISTAATGPDEVSLDLNVGKIEIRFRKDSERGHPGPLPKGEALATRVDGKVFGEMRQRDPEFGPVLPRDKVAGVLGSDGDEIASEWPCQIVSTGFPFAIVPIRDGKSFANLKPDLVRAKTVLNGTGAPFFVLCLSGRARSSARSAGADVYVWPGRSSHRLSSRLCD